jgi:N-acyl-D-aspartate/D-glutamate deacylase
MGKKGSAGKTQSIRFPKWISDALQEIAEKGGHTVTEVVIDLLRQELSIMGYTMGIGRESAENKADRKKGLEAKTA